MDVPLRYEAPGLTRNVMTAAPRIALERDGHDDRASQNAVDDDGRVVDDCATAALRLMICLPEGRDHVPECAEAAVAPHR